VDECPGEYGTYDCWECPNPRAPTHEEVVENMGKRKQESEPKPRGFEIKV
jgi:hypothetical protein